MPPDITADRAADLILERSRRLEAVCRNLAEITDYEPARQVFSDLARMIHTRSQQAIETYVQLNDI